MANEVLFDTSGFFALIDEHDRLHQDAVKWIRQLAGRARPITTEWIIARFNMRPLGSPPVGHLEFFRRL
jgi:predicted nucleic acid-binding protein